MNGMNSMDSWLGTDALTSGSNVSDSTDDDFHAEPCCGWLVAEDVPEYGPAIAPRPSQPQGLRPESLKSDNLVDSAFPADLDDSASSGDSDDSTDSGNSSRSNNSTNSGSSASSTGLNKSGSSPGSDITSRAGSDMKLLRVAMARVEGTQEAATDRTANIRRLRIAVRRAVGIEAADGVIGLDAGAAESIGGDGATHPETLPRDAIAARLKALARTADRDLAEQLRLLVAFEDAKLYKADGCSTMYVWVDRYLKLARTVCFERLRVGRALVDLPVLDSLFALGKLSFSQLHAGLRGHPPPPGSSRQASRARRAFDSDQRRLGVLELPPVVA